MLKSNAHNARKPPAQPHAPLHPTYLRCPQTTQTRTRQAYADLMHRHFLEPPNCISNSTSTMPPPRLTTALLRSRPRANYQCLYRRTPIRFASTTLQETSKPVVPWKTPMSVWSPENLIPPPKEGEVLLERRPNRALPPYVYHTTFPPPHLIRAKYTTTTHLHHYTYSQPTANHTLPASHPSSPAKSSPPSPSS